MKILDYKHRLSQEFSTYADWEMLVSKLVAIPSAIAPVEQASLFVSDSMTEEFETIAQWNWGGEKSTDACSPEQCRKFVEGRAIGDLNFGRCDAALPADKVSFPSELFCLPIRYGERLLGILQFKLKDGETLAEEQVEFFRNIGDEIAVAFKAGQDRRMFYDMRTSETALAERRTVSHYLHDHLGQNLGYLNFKIGQLITEINQLSPDKMLSDLEQMREAANDSYEIVRGTLESIHQETTPLLTNLLNEHARKLSRRANFEIDFKTEGRPIPVATDIQRAVFYVFQESLSNVEKHARASRVDILAEWGEDYFAITISDNGVGFNPNSVNTDQHFGLEIMRERIDKVKGRVTLAISENSGTAVNIWVPITPMSQMRVA